MERLTALMHTLLGHPRCVSLPTCACAYYSDAALRSTTCSIAPIGSSPMAFLR